MSRKERKNKYLNEGERYVIEYDLLDGKCPAQIARRLGRARSTVIREIRRGSCVQYDSREKKFKRVYFADAAQRFFAGRQENKGTGLKIFNDPQAIDVLSEFIKERHWSPDAALGYALRNNLISVCFSTPTLYSYIKAGVMDLTEDDLPRRGKQKKKKRNEYRRAYNTARGTSIEDRPKEIETREEFGHWEGDLIVGKQGTKDVVLTLVERKTRMVMEARFTSKEKWQVPAFFDWLEELYGYDLFHKIFKSVTYDNGVEFIDFEAMERSKDENREDKRTQIYYAHPYCSSERGSNENANGLLRRAGITKGINIKTLSDEEIHSAVEWVNNLPRKILNYQTAKEVYEIELANLI